MRMISTSELFVHGNKFWPYSTYLYVRRLWYSSLFQLNQNIIVITVMPSVIIRFGCGDGLQWLRLWRRDTDCLLNIMVVDSILLIDLNIGMNKVIASLLRCKKATVTQPNKIILEGAIWCYVKLSGCVCARPSGQNAQSSKHRCTFLSYLACLAYVRQIVRD